MRRLLFLLIVLLTLPLAAQEKFTLATPVTTAAKAEYTLRFIRIDWENRVMEISVADNRGLALTKLYDRTTTPTGQTLIAALNRANLTTNSLYKRVLERLAMDGVLETGTVTGTPE